MIVDTSAVIAILRTEPEAAAFVEAIEAADAVRISTASYVEMGAAVDSLRNPSASRRFDEFLREAEVQLEPVSSEQAYLARAAYRDFGKGSGHPARLNYGDCFAYALAKARREPLLYKGGDFALTDIRSAL
ncbi:MAG TPA: type II toxin-antitoxin system VapC family toxin [Terriglobales bacterium]